MRAQPFRLAIGIEKVWRSGYPPRRTSEWSQDNRLRRVLGSSMARVDPDDDTITRFVAWHYKYDLERHERRNVLLAAFDDSTEFEEFVNERAAELRDKQAMHQAAPDEHIGGVIHEPGDRERAQNRRLLSRAMDHGVWPTGWDPENPPDGVNVAHFESPDAPH